MGDEGFLHWGTAEVTRWVLAAINQRQMDVTKAIQKHQISGRRDVLNVREGPAGLERGQLGGTRNLNYQR